jgi:hypothetical protein
LETCFATCWMILILSNLTLRCEILCQMFSSWWDFEEVCVSCAKSACSCCLVLKLLKFSLYLVVNEIFQSSDLEALGCLLYPVVRPSVRSRDHLRKIMSNMVISKLWGVCRTLSCDPPPCLEIIWGFKISKLLHLISYSLACLLTCTNWALSCICECLTKHASWVIVAHLEMISILFIHACLAWDRSPYACGDFVQIATSLNFISSTLLHICYLLMVYLWGLTLILKSHGILLSIVALNICWYNLWSTLILISCIASTSLGLCLMSSLLKGGRMHKVVELIC